MDVKCSRCGMIHELEESRIPDNGVRTRCIRCGHMFKIKKKTILTTESVLPKPESMASHTNHASGSPRPIGTLRAGSASVDRSDRSIEESFFEDQAAKSGPESWGSDYNSESEVELAKEWKRTGSGKLILVLFLLFAAASMGAWALMWPDSFQRVVGTIKGERNQVSDEVLDKIRQVRKRVLMDSNNELVAAKGELEEILMNPKNVCPEALELLAQINITQAEKYRERIQHIETDKNRLQKEIDALPPNNAKEQLGEGQDQQTRLREKLQLLQQEHELVLDIDRRAMEEARKAIDDIEAIARTSFLLRRAKANYLRVFGENQALAEREIKAGRIMKPNDPELGFIMGALYLQSSDKYDTAGALLVKAVALEPNLLKARYHLALLSMRRNQIDQAKACLGEIITLNPSHEQAKTLMTSLEELNKIKEEQKPDDPVAQENQVEEAPTKNQTYDDWMAVAESHLQRGNPNKAINAFDAALDLSPADIEALVGKGLGYMDLDENMIAIELFGRALEKSPRFAVAIMGLAEAYKYLGDQNRALVYYQRYLDVNPGGEEAQIARRNIEKLK